MKALTLQLSIFCIGLYRISSDFHPSIDKFACLYHIARSGHTAWKSDQ